MVEYLDLVEDVLTNGKPKKGPQAVGTKAVFGRQVRFEMKDGFPLLTTRDLSGSWKAMRAELLWILSGSTNANDLHDYGVKLWDQWATPETSGKLGFTDGELGPVYGHQLRNFNGRVDQLNQTVQLLTNKPNSRRGVITYWNPEDVEIDGQERVFIAPCIAMLHFSRQGENLDLHVFQRSVDLPVGAPFDIAEHSLFLMMMSKEIGATPGSLVYTMSDLHIYDDQEPAMKELLTRQPRSKPEVQIDNSPSGTIFDHRMEDFHLLNYDPYPKMKIPVST